MLPLPQDKLDIHLEQRIQERANLGHLYQIEMDHEDGPTAFMTGRAAASIWRVVRDAIEEAGWVIVPR